MRTQLQSKTGVQFLTTALIALFALQLIISPVSATGLPSKTNIKVCLILPTTGGLGTIGVDEIRGADIAVTQANTILAAGSSGVSFSDANRADSATDPAVADTGFKNLVDTQGCQITVGAAGTGETLGFLPDANTRKVPTISPSSTAASAAIAGDELFRTPGPDTIQTVASAKWLYSNGIRHVAIITRNDPYGTNFRDGFKTAFLALSGTTVADPTVTTYDYTSTSDIQAKTDTLNTQIGTILGTPYPANTVAVLVIAFATDGTTLFDKARTETNLPNVNWYGTDGVAGDRAFVPPASGGTASTAVATFLNNVNLTATNPTAPNPGVGGASMGNLAYNGTTVPKNGGGTVDLTGTGYHAVYGITPQPYWDYSYDAAVIAMLSILKANSYVGLDITAQIATMANQTIGATGLLSLASTGDRAVQHYIIYGYTGKSVNGTCCFNWYANSTFSHFYDGDTGSLVTSRPTGSEAGGTIWTDLLQTLAPTVTVNVPVFSSPVIALTSLVLVSSLVLIITRRKRL